LQQEEKIICSKLYYVIFLLKSCKRLLKNIIRYKFDFEKGFFLKILKKVFKLKNPLLQEG